MISSPLNASDIFSSDTTGCLASLCNPIKFEGYTFLGLLVALIIFVVFIYRKRISLKKYLFSQIILFLIFSSTFISSGVNFGCCPSGNIPKRIVSEIWSVFPDQFIPIYFDRIKWTLDKFEIIN